MNFKFKLKDGSNINVFLNTFIKDESKNQFGVVSWNGSKKNGEYKEHHSHLQKDESGRAFFKYYKNVVYMDEFLAKTPEEYINAVNSEKWLSSDELTWTLMKYGIDSIRVVQPKKPMTGFVVGGAFFGFESHSNIDDKSKWDKVEYKFEELDMFKLVDNYKIKLRPVSDEHIGVYASRDYYISDLTSLFRGCKEDYELILGKVA